MNTMHFNFHGFCFGRFLVGTKQTKHIRSLSFLDLQSNYFPETNYQLKQDHDSAFVQCLCTVFQKYTALCHLHKECVHIALKKFPCHLPVEQTEGVLKLTPEEHHMGYIEFQIYSHHIEQIAFHQTDNFDMILE